jgi:hypothetical protein
MLGVGALTFQEFVMNEPLPLAKIHEAVLEFLRGRDDAVVFKAYAVNAYVVEPRMTQDIDLLSPRAEALAEEVREELNRRFHIAARVRVVADGRGYRVFQIQKVGNRHLVDIRQVEQLPPTQTISDIQILRPAELVAAKVIAFHGRRGKPKSGTDWRDVAMLLLTFPELKIADGDVALALVSQGAGEDVQAVWREIVAQDIQAPEDDDDF